MLMLTRTSEVAFTPPVRRQDTSLSSKEINFFAILSWPSKRQKVVSRSSAEAEFVSLSSALFSDAIPMLEKR